jgi:hydroxymethylpyrimidine pyrophosphatase-like HAD family hydrolase
MYKDIYSDDLWYLEVFGETASKYNAVQYLRKQNGFDKVVGFGDNLNDLPLFAACDKCYAVANAKPDVKAKATAVIGSNDEDGVARWLEGNVL